MKRTFAAVICLVLIISLLPVSGLAGLYVGDIVRVTARSPVNVRSEPDAGSRMLGEVMPTNTYTCLGKDGSWYYIQFTSEIRGYIPVKYAEPDTGVLWDDDRADEVEAVVRNTNRNPLVVHTGPDKDSSSFDRIQPDSTWPFYGTENGWHRIMINGRYGYVAANRSEVEITRWLDPEDTTTGPTTVVGTDPCTECESTGDCYTCRNRGYVWGAVDQDYIDCPTCCGLMYCGACGGDGWR